MTVALPGTSRAGRWTRVFGFLSLGVAFAAAVELSLQHLGAPLLPGCTLDSPCARALSGPFGTLPWSEWPLSFAGASAFGGLLAAWSFAHGGWPRSLVWVARVGGLASLALLGIAVQQGTPCPYCITAQLANLAFAACSERARGPQRARRAEFAFALTLVLTSAGFALAHAGERRAREGEAERELERSTRAITAGQDARAFSGRWRLGPERAAARLVFFGDYQCPDCARLEGEARALVAARPEVSLSVKHFPLCRDCNRHARALSLNPHPNACWAARAAEAAGIVGGAQAFWRMDAWLFARGGSFTDVELRTGLAELALDAGPFLEALHAGASLQRVQDDVEEALALGLSATPVVFLNGVELRGWRAPHAIARAVEALLVNAPEVRGAEADRPPDALAKCLEDWRLEPRVELPRRVGAAATAAELEVVLWGDYLDAETREVDRRVRAFRAEHTPVRYSFRHFPLDPACVPSAPNAHPGACLAARWAEAARALAGEGGFERLHEELTRPGKLDEARLVTAAAAAGLDAAALAAAAEAAPALAAVQADVAAARRVDVHSIPLLFVDGKRVTRWRLEGADLLERILTEALAAR